MKLFNHTSLLLATLLCSLSFIWAAPIGRHGDLVTRNPELSYNGRLVARMPTKASGSGRAPKPPTGHKSAKEAITGTKKIRPNPARAHSPTVKVGNGAKKAFQEAGLTHEHFGGKSPEQWSIDHVTQHIKNTPGLSTVHKATITYPPHEGGRGGNGHPVDPTNHFTVQVRHKGASNGVQIHVPVPDGTPKVHLHGETPNTPPPVAGSSTQAHHP